MSIYRKLKRLFQLENRHIQEEYYPLSGLNKQVNRVLQCCPSHNFSTLQTHGCENQNGHTHTHTNKYNITMP